MVDPSMLTKKLDFTVGINKSIPKHELTLEEIKARLKELLLSNENEDIFDWIDTQITASASSDVKFIRTLANMVHKSALTGTGTKWELDKTTLEKRTPLLTSYIDHDENLELQILYEIQQLMNDLKHPKGVLRQIFDILYEYDVISEEIFKNWNQSKDPNELVGKDAAALSVRGFFTWLREAESGEDSNFEDEW